MPVAEPASSRSGQRCVDRAPGGYGPAMPRASPDVPTVAEQVPAPSGAESETLLDFEIRTDEAFHSLSCVELRVRAGRCGEISYCSRSGGAGIGRRKKRQAGT